MPTVVDIAPIDAVGDASASGLVLPNRFDCDVATELYTCTVESIPPDEATCEVEPEQLTADVLRI
jgi:hypothetical protein